MWKVLVRIADAFGLDGTFAIKAGARRRFNLMASEAAAGLDDEARKKLAGLISNSMWDAGGMGALYGAGVMGGINAATGLMEGDLSLGDVLRAGATGAVLGGLGGAAYGRMYGGWGMEYLGKTADDLEAAVKVARQKLQSKAAAGMAGELKDLNETFGSNPTTAPPPRPKTRRGKKASP